jgi:hypothetical protein
MRKKSPLTPPFGRLRAGFSKEGNKVVSSLSIKGGAIFGVHGTTAAYQSSLFTFDV